MPKAAPAELCGAIVAAIRSVDPAHLVILEGNNYAHDFSMLPSPPDRNAMYEFHEYAAFNREWRHPTQASLAPFLALRARTGLPLWLGEFGEDTLAWQAQVVDLLKANGIGWAVWPWKRFGEGGNHPVIQTIRIPPAWMPVDSYLVGRLFAAQPSPMQAEQGMRDVLQAIRTEQCVEDPALARVLAGQ